MSSNSNSFFILTDEIVKACGQNSNGQLGNNSTGTYINPTDVTIPNVNTLMDSVSMYFKYLLKRQNDINLYTIDKSTTTL